MSFTSTETPARPEPVWRNRDLRIVVVARAVSFLGDEAALVALTLRLHDTGAGAWAIAGLLAAGMLPLVLLAPVVGGLVDRTDSRRLLVVSSVLQAVLCAVLALVHAPWAVLALVAALGTGQAVSSATWQALVPRIVGEDRLPAAMGLSQSTFTAAGIAAPALGGLLTGLYGATLPLLLDSATFLAVTAAALLLRTRRGGTVAGQALGRMRDGLVFIGRDRVVGPLVGSLLVFVLLGTMVNVVEVFLVRDVLAASATWYGALGATWSVGLVAGSVLGGRLNGAVRLVGGAIAAAAVMGAVMLGFAAVPTVAWLVPVTVIGGAANGVINLTVGALVMTRAPEAIRGRVAAAMGGLANSASVGSLVLGGLLAGLLAPRMIFVLAGGCGLLVAALAAAPVLRAARLQLVAAGTLEDGRAPGADEADGLTPGTPSPVRASQGLQAP